MIYNNENAREAVRDSSNRIITESTEYISDYKQFLEPLSNVDEQYDRINDLIKYIKDSSLNGKNQFIFKNYYPLVSINNVLKIKKKKKKKKKKNSNNIYLLINLL